ncbi:MAG TPA: CDP-alcohol phosphatidyltransferase family protein [Bacillota bacterium]|nr:CDP-alcohol phosphatidyltransferase family protein [Bacillota bacterium]
MDLHYAAPNADWAVIPPSKRNFWQRLAEKTNSLVAPGNIVSVVSLGLVFYGLGLLAQDHLWSGLTWIGLGRLGDVADGVVANQTGTKSPLGEAVDATCDKIGAFATVIVLIGAGIVWWPAMLALGVYNLVNTVIALLAKVRQITIHPRQTGKLSAFGQWLAVGLLLLAATLHMSTSGWLAVSGYAVLLTSLILGIYATALYVRTYPKSVVPSGAAANRRKN